MLVLKQSLQRIKYLSLRRGYTLQNISFRAFHEIRISRHRVKYREMLMIYFLKPFMKHENSENRFSEFSLS